MALQELQAAGRTGGDRMKVKELIELNNLIGDIKITVREEGNGPLIKELRIGAGASQGPDEQSIILLPEDTNSYDAGRDHYKVLTSKIPRMWLNLKVHAWDAGKAYRLGEYVRSLQHIRITCGPDGYVEQLELDLPEVQS